MLRVALMIALLFAPLALADDLASCTPFGRDACVHVSAEEHATSVTVNAGTPGSSASAGAGWSDTRAGADASADATVAALALDAALSQPPGTFAPMNEASATLFAAPFGSIGIHVIGTRVVVCEQRNLDPVPACTVLV